MMHHPFRSLLLIQRLAAKNGIKYKDIKTIQCYFFRVNLDFTNTTVILKFPTSAYCEIRFIQLYVNRPQKEGIKRELVQ